MNDIDGDIIMTDEQRAQRIEEEAKQEIIITDLLNCITLICKGVEKENDRFIGRALRISFKKRDKFSEPILVDLIFYVIKSRKTKKFLYKYLNFTIEEEVEEIKKKVKVDENLPVEVEVFIRILITVYLIDKKYYSKAVEFSTQMIEYISKFNRTTLYLLLAKAFFYHSRSYELTNKLSVIRKDLLKSFRIANLRRNVHCQSMLINLLLRSYLHYNLYTQADKLISRTEIKFSSNAQESRFHYYKGRILSIHMDYAEAIDCLNLALRKSPSVAKGFRIAVNKLLVTVQLLMGDIPSRSVFSHPTYETPLKPYFNLTKKVRIGDVVGFQEVLEKFKKVFVTDKNFSLCQRIRKNVIRAGLNKIGLSYSRISFKDICKKLNLKNPEDMECIVAKAIKDGIIDATINHEKGYMEINKNKDVYSTFQPSKEMNDRIQFCMNIHNDCVRALSYPSDEMKRKQRLLERRKKKEKEARIKEDEKKKGDK